MADFIEFACDCGKILRVPKSRAGQTGKCARCGEPVKIPVLEEPEHQEEPIISSDETYAPELSFAEPQETSYPYPKKNKSKEEEWEDLPAKSKPKAFAPPPSPPPPASPKKPKPSMSFQQPVARSKNSGGKTKAKTKPKTNSASNSVQRSEPSNLMVSMGNLVLGVCIGVLLGPGYLQIVPAGLIPGLGPKKQAAEYRQYEEPDTSEVIVEDSPPVEKIDDTPEIIEESVELSSHDQGLKKGLPIAMKNAKNYMEALKQHTFRLETNIETLNQYNANNSQDKELLVNAQKKIKYITDCLEFCDTVINAERWNLLDKAHEYLKPFQVAPYKSNLVTSVQRSSEDLDKKVRNLTRYEKTIEKDQVTSRYLGTWYKKLTSATRKLELWYNQDLSIERKASPKFDAIQTEVRKISGYKGDIDRIIASLEKHIQAGNDVNVWIRTQKARDNLGYRKRKQIELLETFLKKGKKFDLPIRSQFNELVKAMRKFEKEKRKIISKSTLSEILKVLQKIDREYQETYQDLNSAVINFTIS